MPFEEACIWRGLTGFKAGRVLELVVLFVAVDEWVWVFSFVAVACGRVPAEVGGNFMFAADF